MGQAISFNSSERILDEGVLVVTTKSINFVGAGVVVTSVAGVATVTIAGSVNGVTVKDEGVSIGTGFTILNVVGGAITATDAGAGQANLTVNAWALDGNTVGSEKYIGTNDAFAFPIYTNGFRRITVATGTVNAGFVSINRATASNMLDIETTTDLAANTGVIRIRNRGDAINDFTEAGILFNVSSGNNPDLGTVGRIYMKYDSTDEGTGRLSYMVKDAAGTLTNVFSIKGIPADGAGATGMGVGLTTPTAKLHVKGLGTVTATYAAKFDTPTSTSILYMRNDTRVSIGADIDTNQRAFRVNQDSTYVDIGSYSGGTYGGIYINVGGGPNNYTLLGNGTSTLLNSPLAAGVVEIRNFGAVIVTVATGGMGVFVVPTAYLHIGAGTAAASTAPIKVTTGTLNSTAEAGALEYATPAIYFTNGDLIRQEIILSQQSRVSTQFNKVDATLANVTGLTANVAAGKVYKFESLLFIDASVVGGSKYAIAGTATATSIIYEIILIDNTTNANTVTSRQTALAGSAGQAGTTSGWCRVTGIIVVNGAGTLTAQFAQNAVNGTSSVLVGSTFTVQQIT